MVPDFLWCADMQEGLKEPLYVDDVHYNAKLTQLLARRIEESIVARGILR